MRRMGQLRSEFHSDALRKTKRPECNPTKTNSSPSILRQLGPNVYDLIQNQSENREGIFRPGFKLAECLWEVDSKGKRLKRKTNLK